MCVCMWMSFDDQTHKPDYEPIRNESKKKTYTHKDSTGWHQIKPWFDDWFIRERKKIPIHSIWLLCISKRIFLNNEWIDHEKRIE